MSSIASNDSRILPVALGWERLPPEYAIPEQAPSLAEAQEYCRRLARTHYENFSVATWFLPSACASIFSTSTPTAASQTIWAMKSATRNASLAMLDAVAGANSMPAMPAVPGIPVFVALEETVRQFDIPKQPFDDLLKAFRQDQSVTRYETFDDVLGYCRFSANPVGHLVLYLCGYRDPERRALSDYTCTALQLANFWQDVSDDYSKGRIYLPLEDLRRYQVTQEDISAARNTPAFCEMMRFQVERARQWFQQGLPLAGRVDRELAIDIELFSRGGEEILNAIERQGYAVLGRRPAISKTRKLALVARAALGKLLGERLGGRG